MPYLSSRTYFITKNSESFYLSEYNRKTKFVGKKNADYCYVNDYLENGDNGNTAFVDVDKLPEYTLCLLKKQAFRTWK